MRDWLRRKHAWVALRRLHREGFARAYKRWRLWSRILSTPPVRTSQAGETELHLLCYRNDYLCAIWALKTFYRFARVDIPLFIHLQGYVPERARRRLKVHFPDARIVSQAEADALVIPELEGMDRLLKGRASNYYMMKLTDFSLIGDAPNLLTLDSDVLFFREPEEFLAATDKHLFQRDPVSTYVATNGLEIHIAPNVNVGMMHFRRDGVSLARCNEYLAHFPSLEGWLEQTLYALHAGERGNAAYLSQRYRISLDRDIDPAGLTARHYAGPSRPLFHEEGIPYLLRTGFLDGDIAARDHD